jgi:hypothetical protein
VPRSTLGRITTSRANPALSRTSLQ